MYPSFNEVSLSAAYSVELFQITDQTLLLKGCKREFCQLTVGPGSHSQSIGKLEPQVLSQTAGLETFSLSWRSVNINIYQECYSAIIFSNVLEKILAIKDKLYFWLIIYITILQRNKTTMTNKFKSSPVVSILR